MCLIAFAWKAHPNYTLIVGANRDEWHDRPAAVAAWWDDHPQILAGRDLKAGGTWLGISRNGRFAALTNFRDPSDHKADTPSRGQLVSNFLSGSDPAQEYLLALRKEASRYQGFNLLIGDGDALRYFSSRTGEILAVPPGVHALSNHNLNEPWPKVKRAKAALDAALGAEMSGEVRPPSMSIPHSDGERGAECSRFPAGERLGMRRAIYDFLSDDAMAPDAALPNTGVGREWERALSPALIVTEKYGTRCSTVLTVTSSGEVAFEERTRDPGGKVTAIITYDFTLA